MEIDMADTSFQIEDRLYATSLLSRMGMKRPRSSDRKMVSADKVQRCWRTSLRRSVLLSAALLSLSFLEQTTAFAPMIASKVPSTLLQSSLSWNDPQFLSITTMDRPPTWKTTASDTTMNTQRRPVSATLKQWKHRLVTKEDPFHSHKITGMLFVLSSLGLTWYAVQDWIQNGWTVPLSVHGTPFVGLLVTLIVSTIAQSFSSIHLACHHRQGQPAVRNTFLCNAAVAVLGSVSALWASTWYPDAWNGLPSKAFYFILDGIGLIGMADNLFRLKELIGSRQTKSADRYDVDGMNCWQYWKDTFVYMMPILIGAPFFLGIGWQFGIQHDRTFYLQLLVQDGTFPHLQSGAVYSMIMVAMGASYSSLVVTLRDKKLISKTAEGLSLTGILVALVWSLYQALRDPGVIVALLGM